MRIFISTHIKEPADVVLHQKLLQELKALGISIITNLDMKKGEFESSGFGGLDAVVIDGAADVAEVGYILAIALANKRPVLYLLPKGSLIDASVQALTKNADVRKLLRIIFYTSDTLILKIKQFLQYLDQNLGRETFSIKYTLRLSPRLDRYLTWRAGQVKKNKADFLRDWVNNLMQSDEEYKKRLD
ncbi:MAG: hypothetical protein AAB490_05105 [Patescibacteria group bacterium]